MTNARTSLGFVAALVILAAGIGASVTNADDPPIKRTELLRTDLTGIEGREVVVYIADVAPGAAGGKHTHPGDEFVYVLEGVLVVQPEAKAPITLKRGEAAHLPPDVAHAARNGSDSEPAKVLVHLVIEKGKPLAEPVK